MKPILAGMLSVSGKVLSDSEKRLLEKSNPLGVTLFKRNIDNKTQLKSLVASIREVIGRDDVLVAVDQEGGRVCRLSEPNWRPYLSQSALGSVDALDRAKLIYLHASLIADDLHELGINWNYAPVLDVRHPETTDALKCRIFSENEKEVANNGEILIQTYQKKGICACVKHFPGHGRATVDPHLHLPVVSDSLDELEQDFYPFKAVSTHAVAGMTAHIVLSVVDDRPVTQSKKAIDDIVRGRIGFDGFLISDAIDMRALGGSLTNRVNLSLDAGCDAISYCMGIEDELREVVDSLKPLSDNALRRFARIQKVVSAPYISPDIEKEYRLYQKYSQQAIGLQNDYDAVEVLSRIQEIEDENSAI